MTNKVFRLECLPNELIIEIFKYIQARDIFQTFYNLNIRFNHLIQSLFHLTYSTNQNDDNPILSYPYIRTLIINTKIEDRLVDFPNIRRLILDYVTEDFLLQLNGDIPPNLEYLSISHKVHPFFMSNLRTKIFSNIFPNLKSCYISRMKPPCSIRDWTGSVSLRVLKVNDINSCVYLSILMGCPNLYFLKFKLPTRSTVQSNSMFHMNLRQLIINMNYDDYPWDDNVIESYLQCVPNLEQFRIYRSISIDLTIMNYLQYYDWLSSIVSSRFKLLNQFEFYLRINRCNHGLLEFDYQDICTRFIRKFDSVHKNRFQSRLRVF